MGQRCALSGVENPEWESKSPVQLDQICPLGCPEQAWPGLLCRPRGHRVLGVLLRWSSLGASSQAPSRSVMWGVRGLGPGWNE